MALNGKNEDLILRPLKNYYNLPKLLNGFDFAIDPDDKEIRSINLNTASLISFNGLLRVVIHVAPINKENIADIIRENHLIVDNIEFRIVFQSGKVNFAKMHDHIAKFETNPIIDKYLKYWGIAQFDN
jgi:hypothetical protein